jgi:hypothetical protein
VASYRLKTYQTPHVKDNWLKASQEIVEVQEPALEGPEVEKPEVQMPEVSAVEEPQIQELIVVKPRPARADEQAVKKEAVEGKKESLQKSLFKEFEEAEDETPESFEAVGYVENYEQGEKDGIYYKIVERGRPVCYVQGVNLILGRFTHQKVTVQGTVNKKLQSKYAYPVISVSSVRLML